MSPQSRIGEEYLLRAKEVADALARSVQMERDFLESKVLNREANEACADLLHKRRAFAAWLIDHHAELFAASETRSSVPVGDIAYAIATDMVRYASTGAQQPAPAGFGPSSLCLARALIAALATPRLGTAALRWAVSTFGEVAEDKEERAMRFLEEAIEVANAVGLPPETLQMIGARVYSRQKGDLSREIGQAMLTLELLADVLTIDPQRAAADEFSRIQSIPKEEWERRHQAKVDMGIAK